MASTRSGANLHRAAPGPVIPAWLRTAGIAALTAIAAAALYAVAIAAHNFARIGV